MFYRYALRLREEVEVLICVKMPAGVRGLIEANDELRQKFLTHQPLDDHEAIFQMILEEYGQIPAANVLLCNQFSHIARLFHGTQCCGLTSAIPEFWRSDITFQTFVTEMLEVLYNEAKAHQKPMGREDLLRSMSNSLSGLPNLSGEALVEQIPNFGTTPNMQNILRTQGGDLRPDNVYQEYFGISSHRPDDALLFARDLFHYRNIPSGTYPQYFTFS